MGSNAHQGRGGLQTSDGLSHREATVTLQAVLDSGLTWVHGAEEEEPTSLRNYIVRRRDSARFLAFGAYGHI